MNIKNIIYMLRIFVNKCDNIADSGDVGKRNQINTKY